MSCHNGVLFCISFVSRYFINISIKYYPVDIITTLLFSGADACFSQDYETGRLSYKRNPAPDGHRYFISNFFVAFA